MTNLKLISPRNICRFVTSNKQTSASDDPPIDNEILIHSTVNPENSKFDPRETIIEDDFDCTVIIHTDNQQLQSISNDLHPPTIRMFYSRKKEFTKKKSKNL